jgi:hypothetical protein
VAASPWQPLARFVASLPIWDSAWRVCLCSLWHCGTDLAVFFFTTVYVWCLALCGCDGDRGGVRPRKWSYMSPALLNLTAHGQPCHGVATVAASVCASFLAPLAVSRSSEGFCGVHASCAHRDCLKERPAERLVSSPSFQPFHHIAIRTCTVLAMNASDIDAAPYPGSAAPGGLFEYSIPASIQLQMALFNLRRAEIDGDTLGIAGRSRDDIVDFVCTRIYAPLVRCFATSVIALANVRAADP